MSPWEKWNCLSALVLFPLSVHSCVQIRSVVKCERKGSGAWETAGKRTLDLMGLKLPPSEIPKWIFFGSPWQQNSFALINYLTLQNPSSRRSCPSDLVKSNMGALSIGFLFDWHLPDSWSPSPNDTIPACGKSSALWSQVSGAHLNPLKRNTSVTC